MTVSVLLFASAREWTGRGRLRLRVESGTPVKALLERGPLRALKAKAAFLRFAVNEKLVGASRRLKDGDVVAVLPPVSGG